jgi:hypothetical protein
MQCEIYSSRLILLFSPYFSVPLSFCNGVKPKASLVGFQLTYDEVVCGLFVGVNLFWSSDFLPDRRSAIINDLSMSMSIRIRCNKPVKNFEVCSRFVSMCWLLRHGLSWPFLFSTFFVFPRSADCSARNRWISFLHPSAVSGLKLTNNSTR